MDSPSNTAAREPTPADKGRVTGADVQHSRPSASGPGSPLITLAWLAPLQILAALCLQPCLFVLLNSSIPQMFGGPPGPWYRDPDVLLIVLGTIFSVLAGGQLILALYLTWSPGRFWVKLIRYWLIMAALFGCYYIGFTIRESVYAWLRPGADPYDLGPSLDERQFMLIGLCTMPMSLLSLQLPFWAARFVFGCRLERSASTSTLDSSRAIFSISDLLWGTAIVAFSLGCLQLPVQMMSGDDQRGESGESPWIPHLVSAAQLVGWGLIVGVALAVLFLRRWPLWAAWLLTLLVHGVIYTLVLYGVGLVEARYGVPQQPLVTQILSTYTVIISYSLGLTLLRVYGWLMVAGWKAIA